MSPGQDQLRAVRRLTLDSALREVVRAFAVVGVRPLLIKGPAFARWLYEDQRGRHYRDIDLLVAPEHFEAARQSLVELGFEQPTAGLYDNEAAQHHESWERIETLPAVVELHHTLYFLSAPPALVWQRLSEDAHPIDVGGTPVDAPGVAASALIVGLHAAQHGAGARRPIRDLERALARVDLEGWRAAAMLARELGAAAAFATGLRLAPGGAELVGRLGLSPETASRTVRLRARTAPDTAIGIERLLTTRGGGARLVLLAHELVPSPAFMRAWQPLARRGRWGLIASYLWRPFWLAVKLPRGARAWLQAAKPPRR